MEKKKLKKLVLKKQTISSLDDNSLSKLKGGESAPVFSGEYNECVQQNIQYNTFPFFILYCS
jgi:natural product precursor